MLLRDLLGQRYGTLLSVRIGLHMGPVRVISDINDRVNVVGDGINVGPARDGLRPGQPGAGLALVLRRDLAHHRRHGRPVPVPGPVRRQARPPARGVRGQPASAAAALRAREGPSTGYTHTLPVKSMQGAGAGRSARGRDGSRPPHRPARPGAGAQGPAAGVDAYRRCARRWHRRSRSREPAKLSSSARAAIRAASNKPSDFRSHHQPVRCARAWLEQHAHEFAGFRPEPALQPAVAFGRQHAPPRGTPRTS